jgi:hypothetical protein
MTPEFTSDTPRLGGAQAAASTYRKLWNDGDKRRQHDALVLGQLSGKRPYSAAKLLESGQSWRANINFRDASSTLEQVLVGYWRLLHDVQDLASVTVLDETPYATKFQHIFQKNFDRFYEDWGVGYVTEYLKAAWNHVTFGAAPLLYITPDSPRYVALGHNDLLVPHGTAANVDDFEFCMIRRKVNISQIWGRIRTPKLEDAAKTAGWDVSILKDVLSAAIKGVNDPDAGDWLELERELRTKSLSTSAQNERVLEVTVFVKEFDGQIARYVIYPDQQGVDADTYAFSDRHRPKRPERMSQCLAVLFFEVAFDGLYHEVSGFGRKNYDIATTQNRLKSRAVDRTAIDGLNFRDMSDGRRTTLGITNMGPVNVFPKDLEQIPQYPSGTTVFDAIALLDSQFNSNNARYRDQSQTIRDTNTATQATILANLQSQVDVANATLYLKQIQMVFAEQFSRLRRRGNTDADAKTFYDRCVKQAGMPEEVFFKATIEVRTGANPGTASSALRADVARDMIQLSGNPLVNPRWPLETYITARLGAAEVQRALVPEQASSQDEGQRRQAIMENTHLGEGVEIPVARDDLHHIHIPEHLQPLAAMVQQYEQTQNIEPQQLLAMQLTIPHLEAHFEFLQQDSFQQQAYQQLWPVFTRIQSVVQGIMTRLEDIRQQMEQTGEPPAQAQQMAL